MLRTLELITPGAQAPAEPATTFAAATSAEPGAAAGRVLQIPNDADPLEFDLQGVQRIELQFPKPTDGRAFSQAQLLRRRRGFTGDIRATGAVLVDWLVHMQRSGFSSAVLRADQDLAVAQRQFDRYPEYYQGDVQQTRPRFARAEA